MPADLQSGGASITLRGLTKHYGDAVAVAGIDLEARPGEFLTFLGPSGSGKTTTLNMIAGFIDVTAGELLIDGQAVHSLPPHKRDIGMVFQQYALFPHMTVAENVAYPLKQRKVEKGERGRLVTAALAAVGLDGYDARRPSELSGGQQQRVALARAIVYSPQVLLMDEPLGALDRKLRDTLQLEIKRIHAELGTTFVYVTHDQEEALALSDRIAVFNAGRIEQVGTAEELYDAPETVFCAQFLGESTLLQGTARPDGGATLVEGPGVRVHAGRGHHSAGAAAVVVRPERITLVPATDDAPAGNAVRGRVTEDVYLGNGRKLQIELPDGSAGTVRETAAARSACRSGDEVWLTFSADDAVVLPDDGASAPTAPVAAGAAA
ncbi:ABC transporter ATP-binding protein [Patulibacter americanus]|uniref:ABC transporter ATP-binding protein n=1 Tax=Patulibacter americanus TaxID=588672 RepID=UPI0003B760D0|nr:ABC transporter ATP-binding protein [Patulibacter americanus]